jgi:hypothetical protein
MPKVHLFISVLLKDSVTLLSFSQDTRCCYPFPCSGSSPKLTGLAQVKSFITKVKYVGPNIKSEVGKMKIVYLIPQTFGKVG